MRINPAVRWIKPKSPEENGFGSEVYICSEGKELRCASSGNQFGGQFGPKQRGHFHRNTQDVQSILYFDTKKAKELILEFAAQQFIKGDVLQWWDPISRLGFRTKSSDDHLWLVFAICKYVKYTGDTDILQNQVPYLEGRELRAEEDSMYTRFLHGKVYDSLLDHCVKAINYSLEVGGNRLPLLRLGDWNLGLDNIDSKNKAESVWLSFFLYEILSEFSSVLEEELHMELKVYLNEKAHSLSYHIDQSCWDGKWYKRAIINKELSLGSDSNPEYQIDSITQSWAVISRGGDELRSKEAIYSAFELLMDNERRLLMSFAPAINNKKMNIGHIGVYPPGMKENASHLNVSAIWMAMAFAKLKDPKRLSSLLEIINPASHSKPKNLREYRLEPYLIADDIYLSNNDAGYGGWNWYTGAASWMYNLVLESLIGVKRRGDYLEIDPCLPIDWKEVSVQYRFKNSMYHIHIQQSVDVADSVTCICENEIQKNNRILLEDNLLENKILVRVTLMKQMDLYVV